MSAEPEAGDVANALQPDIDRAAACIWGEITDEFWSSASTEQQQRYRGIAQAALTAAFAAPARPEEGA